MNEPVAPVTPPVQTTANLQTREVLELKPNNPRQIRLGNQQLNDYIAELNEMYPGEPWTGRVVTYDRP